MDIRYFDDLNVAVASPRGAYSLAEVLGWSQTLRADPGFRTGMNEIYDLSDVDPSGVHYDDVQDLIDQVRPASRADVVCVAIIAPSDLAFGLARMYVSLGSSEARPGPSVFRSLDEALTWLAVEVATQDSHA